MRASIALPPSGQILRHVRRDSQIPRLLHKSKGVESFISAQRHRVRASTRLQHHQRRIALPSFRWPETLLHRRSVRCDSPPADFRCNSASIPCLTPCAPAERPDLSSIHASHWNVAHRESPPWDCRIDRGSALTFFGLETLQTCAGFHQRAIDRKC